MTSLLCRRWPDLDEIWKLDSEQHANYRDLVKIATGSRILKLVLCRILFFCFPNAVWASASGGFALSYSLWYTCYVTKAVAYKLPTCRWRNCWTGSRRLGVCCDVGFGGFRGLKFSGSTRREMRRNCTAVSFCWFFPTRWSAVIVKFCCWSIFSLYRTIVSQSSRDAGCSVTGPPLFRWSRHLPSLRSFTAVTSSPQRHRAQPSEITE